MKYYLFFMLMYVVFVSCNKSAPSAIYGRWKVVSDSSITRGSSASYQTYYGNDSDYFNFSSDGSLQTKESAAITFYSYKIKAADSITITQSSNVIDFPIPQIGTYFITDNKARISIAPHIINPGFSYQRIINLKR